MSLLWRNKQLRVGLAADRIYLTGAKSVDLAANDGNWDAPLAALPAVLADKKGEASVVLADQFVRYTLLPWNEALKTSEQWTALATHRFTTLHGPRAAEWQINVTETAPMGPRLACAVDRALIERGMWVAIRGRRADKGWRNVLPEILERESAFLGLSQPVTRLIICAQGDSDTAKFSEMYEAWRTEALAYRELALAAE